MAYLFHLSIDPKDLTQVIIWNRRIQVEDNQGSLIHILVRRIVLRDQNDDQ